ncbi:MAG: PQQ-binding-like beta-propeller repeat protein, partial [Bryobacteraceae bacterium]
MKSNAIIFYPFLALTLFAQAPTPPPSFNATVRPFLEKNCQKCHNGKLQSGDINFEVLKYSNSLGPQAQIWETTSYALKMGQMPPEGSPRPEKDQVDSVIAVLEKDLAKAKEAPAAKAAPPTREWLTWQGDPERTGWAKAETTLAKDNISGLSLLWKSQLDAVPSKVNAYSTLTDPLIAENVPTKQGLKKLVYVASAENNVYALDANTGAQFWERKFPTDVKPPQPASGMCPNNLNATPVIDKQSGTIYFLPTDGKLRGVSLSNGEDKFPATVIVPPYSRNFSLNLVDGMIYTSTARGCANATSEVVGIDVAHPDHQVSHFYLSPGKASGPWGRGGIVETPFGMLAQTADGPYDPASGRFGSTVVGLTKQVRL